jgi:hypothetical protein
LARRHKCAARIARDGMAIQVRSRMTGPS